MQAGVARCGSGFTPDGLRPARGKSSLTLRPAILPVKTPPYTVTSANRRIASSGDVRIGSGLP